MTKADKIRMHLAKYGSISSAEAFELYHATRLAAMVYNLKEQGMDITTHIEHTKDEDGRKINYARYFLEGGNNGGKTDVQ